jgi:hypothetical protein
MRSVKTGALVCLFVVLSGCSATSGNGSAARTLATPSPSTFSSPSPSAGAVDIVPKLTNPAGYPPCGFYTWVENAYNQLTTHLSLAVAAAPAGTDEEADVTVTVNGDEYRSATFRAGQIVRGKYWSPPGTTALYLTLHQGPIPGVGSPYLTRTTTIKVEVDPANKIQESDETNNTVTMQVKPTKRDDIAVTDNRCAVAR